MSEAEPHCGAVILPLGRRRETFFFEIEAMLGDAFEDRVHPFEGNATRVYGYTAAARRSAGHPVASTDCRSV